MPVFQQKVRQLEESPRLLSALRVPVEDVEAAGAVSCRRLGIQPRFAPLAHL